MGSPVERGVARRSERWTIRPLERPRLARYCPGCRAVRELVCSGKFRVNAQKKALDVWLKYRCEHCNGAWKGPILERCPLSQLDPELLEAFERDEPALVDRYAFDVARWRAHVIRVAAPSLRIERSALACACTEAASLCVHLEAPFACDVRLDRLLAAELGHTRADLARWLAAGALTISPAQRDPLRKRARDGQRICFR
jgi:hypothetical protein